MSKVRKAFSKSGALASAIDGFNAREAQIDMALAVEKSIKQKSQLIVEAGTGTGKTFAYLVPTLMSDKKTIISTGTKNLQEQLFARDLPLIKGALGAHHKLALLKGRSNYLCTYRLAQHMKSSALQDKVVLNQLSEVKTWSTTTKSGDMGELNTIPEDARVLPFVTSNADNCMGRDCPDYEDCYLVKARREAMDADVVVVNHHLFFADMALKDTGFGELIPEADVIVFDESHQIPEIASEYFGEAVSTRQLSELAKDIELLYRTEMKDAEQLSKVAKKLALGAADLRLCYPEKPQRGNWALELSQTSISRQVERLEENLGLLYDVMKVHVGRNKALDALFERVISFRQTLKKVNDVTATGVSLWYETTQKHMVLHLTPLTIAPRFAQFVTEPKRSWIFTSATLMVGDSFEHYKNQMGLYTAETLSLDSPFDYPNQAMLCVPRYLPEPNARDMRAKLVDVAAELVAASHGRCFLLFTSHAVLRHVASELESRVDNPLLVQGTTSKSVLLKQYLEDQSAVLLGTGAFWEGVDVRGNDLMCVMIDKLPFAAPDDPLLQARLDDCKKRGYNGFTAIQIPKAVIALKQGAGRLIRDKFDKGVLVICDNRLVTKDYGKTFVSSLPNMKRTRDLDQVVSFLHSITEEPS